MRRNTLFLLLGIFSFVITGISGRFIGIHPDVKTNLALTFYFGSAFLGAIFFMIFAINASKRV